MFSFSTYIGNKQNNVYVESTLTDSVVVTKFLRVDIDNKVTLNDLINTVCGKMFFQSYT